MNYFFPHSSDSPPFLKDAKPDRYHCFCHREEQHFELRRTASLQHWSSVPHWHSKVYTFQVPQLTSQFVRSVQPFPVSGY